MPKPNLAVSEAVLKMRTLAQIRKTQTPDDQPTNASVTSPHCDQRVLHAPGDCHFCDMHPDAQHQRTICGINFTGERRPSLAPCPADAARGDTHTAWAGNAAYPTPDKIRADAEVAKQSLIATLRRLR